MRFWCHWDFWLLFVKLYNVVVETSWCPETSSKMVSFSAASLSSHSIKSRDTRWVLTLSALHNSWYAYAYSYSYSIRILSPVAIIFSSTITTSTLEFRFSSRLRFYNSNDSKFKLLAPFCLFLGWWRRQSSTCALINRFRAQNCSRSGVCVRRHSGGVRSGYDQVGHIPPAGDAAISNRRGRPSESRGHPDWR